MNAETEESLDTTFTRRVLWGFVIFVLKHTSIQASTTVELIHAKPRAQIWGATLALSLYNFLTRAFLTAVPLLPASCRTENLLSPHFR